MLEKVTIEILSPCSLSGRNCFASLTGGLGCTYLVARHCHSPVLAIRRFRLLIMDAIFAGKNVRCAMIGGLTGLTILLRLAGICPTVAVDVQLPTSGSPTFLENSLRVIVPGRRGWNKDDQCSGFPVHRLLAREESPSHGAIVHNLIYRHFCLRTSFCRRPTALV